MYCVYVCVGGGERRVVSACMHACFCSVYVCAQFGTHPGHLSPHASVQMAAWTTRDRSDQFCRHRDTTHAGTTTGKNCPDYKFATGNMKGHGTGPGAVRVLTCPTGSSLAGSNVVVCHTDGKSLSCFDGCVVFCCSRMRATTFLIAVHSCNYSGILLKHARRASFLVVTRLN